MPVSKYPSTAVRMLCSSLYAGNTIETLLPCHIIPSWSFSDYQHLSRERAKGKRQIKANQQRRLGQPRFHRKRHEPRLAVDNVELGRLEEVAQRKVREHLHVGVVVKIVFHAELEVGLN